MNIEEIYTPLEKAKEEIKKRWNDKELEKKVFDYLHGNIPEPLLKEPRSICTDQLASPNWFFFNFYEKAKEADLKPLSFEYLDDIFVTTNFTKASWAKLVFYHGRDDYGDMVTSSRQIIDLTGKNEKKKIRTIHTLWDENLADFHHRMLNKFYDGVEIYDGSDWYHKMGKNPLEQYKSILALYLRNGILFEVFSLHGSEKKFTEEVLMPAFEFVTKEFGLKPLIVPVVSKIEEDDKQWWCYPEFMKTLIDKK